MRNSFALIVAAIVLVGYVCHAQQHPRSSKSQEFKSPDGSVVAVVRSKQVPDATAESRVELRTQEGRVIAKRDYTSEDGEHGYGVTKATWTPDSQFFVYSLESSGGHSPWHSPVQFFSRERNKIVSLDDALNDAVMNPQFLVSAPDRVTVELWFSKKTKTVALHLLRIR
jgi:dipeptidyl aminopeptidase/acylaminoacyl peptidase